jgi:hypothetical protein
MVVTMTLMMMMVIIVKYAPKVIVVPLVNPHHNHALRVIIAHQPVFQIVAQKLLNVILVNIVPQEAVMTPNVQQAVIVQTQHSKNHVQTPTQTATKDQQNRQTVIGSFQRGTNLAPSMGMYNVPQAGTVHTKLK